jgi:hypothetical protein
VEVVVAPQLEQLGRVLLIMPEEKELEKHHRVSLSSFAIIASLN